MQIRSITAFTDIVYPFDERPIAEAGRFLGEARAAYEAEGYTVQTVRLATQPFPAVLGDAGPEAAVALAGAVDAAAQAHGIGYAAIGPARLDDPVGYIEALPDMLAATENLFASITIAERPQGLSLPAIRRAAEVVQRVSTLSDDGFGNLYLAALANCPPGAPFFPAAYHGGGPARFAIATESADLAVTAFEGAGALAEARANLVAAVEFEAGRVSEVAAGLSAAHDFRFGGIDFSLAPYPEESRSIGAALESLGLPAIGLHGSTLVASLVAESIDRADFQRTGFSGLFLPVLEDATLASRAAEGTLSLSDLLLYSALCGTGLDTIPLPGEVGVDALAAILIDVAALALRLDKPLTARLMPLPGKQAGDPVTFDFPYFADSRVMTPMVGPLRGLLAGDEVIDLDSRTPR